MGGLLDLGAARSTGVGKASSLDLLDGLSSCGNLASNSAELLLNVSSASFISCSLVFVLNGEGAGEGGTDLRASDERDLFPIVARVKLSSRCVSCGKKNCVGVEGVLCF